MHRTSVKSEIPRCAPQGILQKESLKNINMAVLNHHHEDVKIRLYINLNRAQIYCKVSITSTNSSKPQRYYTFRVTKLFYKKSR